MFKRIVSVAALAGVISGLLLTVIQQIEIVPLIEAAEAREAANLASQAHQHSEANQPWTPHDGWERALATAVSKHHSGDRLRAAAQLGDVVAAKFRLARRAHLGDRWLRGVFCRARAGAPA
jgi:predicted cobalt transporter CbtA